MQTREGLSSFVTFLSQKLMDLSNIKFILLQLQLTNRTVGMKTRPHNTQLSKFYTN